MEEVIGMSPNEDKIIFTRQEWKHFIDEVGMRKGQEIEKCINNARYLAKLDRADEQIRKGHVIVKTLEELEAME
ncbi:MAG: type II toxin-antitoxin system Phd/YefM family antitoxin [Selenomonadaceae bacterium]|nr:type II toxin-antitoxin system Phd/YefM family antitoxin [Selenomonadaceae bacterium]